MVKQRTGLDSWQHSQRRAINAVSARLADAGEQVYRLGETIAGDGVTLTD